MAIDGDSGWERRWYLFSQLESKCSVDKEYGLGKNQVLSPLAKDFILSSAVVHMHSQQLFKYNHRITILLNGSIFFDSVLRNRQDRMLAIEIFRYPIMRSDAIRPRL